MKSFREWPVRVAPIFDAARAARTIAELEQAAPQIPAHPGFRALIEGASGNSPYLARLILKEKGSAQGSFLGALLDREPQEVLCAMEAEAHFVGREVGDEAEAMRRLRVAKRRAALVIALADIGG